MNDSTIILIVPLPAHQRKLGNLHYALFIKISFISKTNKIVASSKKIVSLPDWEFWSIKAACTPNVSAVNVSFCAMWKVKKFIKIHGFIKRKFKLKNGKNKRAWESLKWIRNNSLMYEIFCSDFLTIYATKIIIFVIRKSRWGH